MKHMQSVVLCTLVLATAATITRATETPKPNQSAGNAPNARTEQSDRGQQVFAQNCSRCHNAPEGFSSHISGTIARHMRVRASLSEEDYKALRKFLNP